MESSSDNHFAHQDDASYSTASDRDLDSGSLNTSTGDDNRPRVHNEAPTLAGSDTKRVNRSKRLLYLVLLLTSVAVGFASYYYLSKDETYDFYSKFDAYADALVDGTDQNAKDIFGKLVGLSHAVTADTNNGPSSTPSSLWPNVTLPNFDIRATPAFDSISNSELFFFAPIVSANEKNGWEEYAWDHQGWIQDDLELRSTGEHDTLQGDSDFLKNLGTIPRRIHPFFPDEEYDLSEIETFVPIWQLGPINSISSTSVLLLDLYSHPSFRRLIDDALRVRHMLLSEVLDTGLLDIYEATSNDNEVVDVPKVSNDNPRSFGLQPVYETFGDDARIVGFVLAAIPWDIYFSNILQSDASGLLVEVTDTCGGAFTYAVHGPKATFLGSGLVHDSTYDGFRRSHEFAEFARFDGHDTSAYMTHCSYTMSIFPSAEFQEHYKTKYPTIIAAVLVVIFLFTMLVFKVNDILVQRRQNKVMATATRTTQLVSSLFPTAVQERIFNLVHEEQQREEAAARQKGTWFGNKNKLDEFLDVGGEFGDSTLRQQQEGMNASAIVHKGTPIADLFPCASVVFADLVGFTAWSSVREPAQVFQLLETLYNSFDELARRRGVYKVETIGDCWVGACGLPDVRKDHAVCMARFSRDMLQKMKVLVKQLERDLGPDTGELAIRIGIHSGPVTAGVLRGDRARFQLFGDAVNTAARMESNGQKNKIHISRETADLLRAAGKDNWIVAREDKIIAKGKGEMETFWLRCEKSGSSKKSSRCGSDVSSTGADELVYDVEGEFAPAKHQLSEKYQRLVSWNVEILARLLKEIQATREVNCIKPDSEEVLHRAELSLKDGGSLVLDELVDIIQLPACHVSGKMKRCDEIDLSAKVMGQLSDFISELASHYKENAFHNFEHASHVTMSVVKLLSRIVKRDHVDTNEETLYGHAYGLTSDPLVQFSVVFSAIAHDVEHPGVPNVTLHKENDALAVHYKQSVAEQHSIDVAWNLLHKEEYIDLRRTIYSTDDELRRFRQLVVNTVMATDIADKELGAARKQRWNLAFAPDSTVDDDVNRDRKATIVLEHLIQASDIAHTMQHWHIYRKWNERFFTECYQAYMDGRADTDPSENWYKGELAFFDFYIIPLAKKLDDCKVFGVSSQEYLNYALSNRKEWEQRGQEIVARMVEMVKGT